MPQSLLNHIKEKKEVTGITGYKTALICIASAKPAAYVV